jgi:hypothetical protein
MPDFYTMLAWTVAILAAILGIQVFGVVAAMALLLAAIFLLAAASYTAGRRIRLQRGRRDPRFEPTEEVFRDPRSKQLMRVHVDPASGERRYWQDS